MDKLPRLRQSFRPIYLLPEQIDRERRQRRPHRIEDQGHRGKAVTIITGVPLTHDNWKALAKSLKAKCGSGGTVKDGVIEIQDDHWDMLLEELKKHGWQVKRSGG